MNEIPLHRGNLCAINFSIFKLYKATTTIEIIALFWILLQFLLLKNIFSSPLAFYISC